jgi:hypothetical protein
MNLLIGVGIVMFIFALYCCIDMNRQLKKIVEKLDNWKKVITFVRLWWKWRYLYFHTWKGEHPQKKVS